MSSRRLVILDKNFLQSEDRTMPRLRALARCGCEFVLIDTLIYELCSDSRLANLWQSIQKKLFPFAERCHLWFHSSELLRQEVVSNGPVVGPEDEQATRSFREQLRAGQVYVPPNLKQIVKEAYQQREIDSMQQVAPMARAFGEMIVKIAASAGFPKLGKDELGRWVRDNFDDQRLIKWAIRACYGRKLPVLCRLVRWAIRACYGTPKLPDNFIPEAEIRVTSSWFAYQNARVTLALIAIFLSKYGLTEQPGKKFPNTKLDLEYLAILGYADALASDETSGDMADMCEWLYGSTKKRISSLALLRAVPREEDVRLRAYWKWVASGRTHGHDVEDWLASESELYEAMWSQL